MEKEKIKIQYVSVDILKPAEYNPRKHTKEAAEQLKESIKKFEMIDPIICNGAFGREQVVIGGHFRLAMAKELGIITVPVVYVNIPEPEREKELNLRLNKNVGEFDLELLAEFDEAFLSQVGFSSEEMDKIFEQENIPENFDIAKELAKLNIDTIQTKTGDMYDLNGSRIRCGDSMNQEDMLNLMGGEKADMVMTDPPYILDYLHGKKKKDGKTTEGFGLKRDRTYIGTESLPDDFTEKWMANVAKVQNKDFSIIVYENWKNIRTIWNEMEKYWKVKNMVVWHLPNRTQGFAGKHKFFSKHDIAMVGISEEHSEELNMNPEDELLQNEYETALYAISGNPQWESYEKGKKIQPTDFIEYKASDASSSGQSIIFGTKPTEILIPYIKVLTTRDQLVLEPFGGSGSTLIASTKMQRKCYVMEKCPIYVEVIIKRWEKLTGLKAKKINEIQNV